MLSFSYVKEIRYKEEYAFKVLFEDGSTGEFDVSPFLGIGTVFEPLRDVSFCKRAFVDGGAITWPNGADIAPETVYEQCLQSAPK